MQKTQRFEQKMAPSFFSFFFCLVFFVVLRPFCLSGAPFLIYAVFFRPRPKPQSRGPYVFAQFSAKNTDFFTFFSPGPLVLFLVLLFLLF